VLRVSLRGERAGPRARLAKRARVVVARAARGEAVAGKTTQRTRAGLRTSPPARQKHTECVAQDCLHTARRVRQGQGRRARRLRGRLSRPLPIERRGPAAAPDRAPFLSLSLPCVLPTFRLLSFTRTQGRTHTCGEGLHWAEGGGKCCVGLLFFFVSRKWAVRDCRPRSRVGTQPKTSAARARSLLAFGIASAFSSGKKSDERAAPPSRPSPTPTPSHRRGLAPPAWADGRPLSSLISPLREKNKSPPPRKQKKNKKNAGPTAGQAARHRRRRRRPGRGQDLPHHRRRRGSVRGPAAAHAAADAAAGRRDAGGRAAPPRRHVGARGGQAGPGGGPAGGGRRRRRL
jgi:hypothetical protein